MNTSGRKMDIEGRAVNALYTVVAIARSTELDAATKLVLITLTASEVLRDAGSERGRKPEG